MSDNVLQKCLRGLHMTLMMAHGS